MPKITLLSPAIDAAGGYRDTGAELTVNKTGKPETVSPERATELIDADQAAPGATAQRDPLDHDGDGRKGGSLPREA